MKTKTFEQKGRIEVNGWSVVFSIESKPKKKANASLIDINWVAMEHGFDNKDIMDVVLNIGLIDGLYYKTDQQGKMITWNSKTVPWIDYPVTDISRPMVKFRKTVGLEKVPYAMVEFLQSMDLENIAVEDLIPNHTMLLNMARWYMDNHEV